MDTYIGSSKFDIRQEYMYMSTNNNNNAMLIKRQNFLLYLFSKIGIDPEGTDMTL